MLVAAAVRHCRPASLYHTSVAWPGAQSSSSGYNGGSHGTEASCAGRWGSASRGDSGACRAGISSWLRALVSPQAPDTAAAQTQASATTQGSTQQQPAHQQQTYAQCQDQQQQQQEQQQQQQRQQQQQQQQRQQQRQQQSSAPGSLAEVVAAALQAARLAQRLEAARNADRQLLAAHQRLLDVVTQVQHRAPLPTLSKLQAFALGPGLSHLTAPWPLGGGASEGGGWEAGDWPWGDKDPFGLMLAMSPSNPLRPLSLSEYLTLASHLAPVMGQRPATQQQQAHVFHTSLNLNSNSNSDPGAEGLSEADFDSLFQLCRQRRETVDRLLQRGQPLSPQEQQHCQSVLRQVSELEAWLTAALSWRAVHAMTLKRHLARLRLSEVEVRLKLSMGDRFEGSQGQALLKRTAPLLRAAVSGSAALTPSQWQELREGVWGLAGAAWPHRSLSAWVGRHLQQYEQEQRERLGMT